MHPRILNDLGRTDVIHLSLRQSQNSEYEAVLSKFKKKTRRSARTNVLGKIRQMRIMQYS